MPEHDCESTGFSRSVLAMLSWGIGIGVPVALIALALAFCATQPYDSGFGGIEMGCLIVIGSFLYGWMFSGIACCLFGRILNRGDRIRRHQLESLGLRFFMAGLALLILIVGVIAWFVLGNSASTRHFHISKLHACGCPEFSPMALRVRNHTAIRALELHALGGDIDRLQTWLTLMPELRCDCSGLRTLAPLIKRGIITKLWQDKRIIRVSTSWRSSFVKRSTFRLP